MDDFVSDESQIARQPEQKRWPLILKILGGVLPGLLPVGILAVSAYLVFARFGTQPAWSCHHMGMGFTGFKNTALPILIASMVGLCFKWTRLSSFIAIIIIIGLGLALAFLVFILMAFASDTCLPYGINLAPILFHV